MTDVRDIPALSQPEEELKIPGKKYVPEGFKTVEDYLENLRESYTNDLMADDDNRKQAVEDKAFVAGDQWDPQVLQQRQGLPCLTINTLPQFTAQLTGDWRENRNGVKVLPSEGGDKAIADVRSDLIRSIETKNRATRVYDSAFESMIQCGDGAFRVAVQYTSEDVFDQEIVLLPIDDALSVVWDRLSIDTTGRDARHCFVDDLMPLKEFNAQWPDSDPSTLSPRERKPLYAQGWIDDSTVRVTEHWRMIERKKMLVMFKDGTIYPFEEGAEKNLDEYEQKHGPMVKARVAPCRYAQMHLVTGFKILAGPYEWKMNRLPIIRMAGRTVTVGDRRVRYGLIRYMKDDARLRNFWQSSLAEQMGYAPKAQWIATESAVEGREDSLRKAHLTRDPLLVVNDEAVIGQNLQRLDPPQVQAALLQAVQLSVQNMKDITGIHDASLGIKSNETSGRAIMARQREGDVASLTYYDNGNAAVLEAGDVMNQLIPQIYDGTRIVRIIGEDESSKLVNINDPMDPKSPNLATGNYDVAITSGPSYTTRRVEAAQAMMEAIQVAPELMQVAGDIVVRAQDWPGAEELSDRLRKTVPPQLLSEKEKQEMGEQGGPDVNALMQQQAQMQEQMQQSMQELQKLQVENQMLKMKDAAKTDQAEIDRFNAETNRLKVLADIAAQGKENEIRLLEHEAEMVNTHVDRLVNIDQAEQDRNERSEVAKQKASSSKASTQPSE